MTPRYTGRVTFWNPVDDFGEITAEGWQPMVASGADLRRLGATALGTRLSYEHGVLAGGNGGCVNLAREPS